MVLLVESGIERDVRTWKIDIADEGRGLRGSVDAIHADVLPLDGERAGVFEIVERDDDVFEFDIAMATRFGEAAYKQTIDEAIARNRARINAILAQYGVPLLNPAPRSAAR